MRNVYVLWNDEAGKYIGRNGDLVGFDKARLFNRKSDAVLSKKYKSNAAHAEPVAIEIGSNYKEEVVFEGTVLEIARKLKDLYDHLGEDTVVSLTVSESDYFSILDALVAKIDDELLQEVGEIIANSAKSDVKG